MKTLNTWAASLALALFIAAAGGLMDGPSELEAIQDTALAADTQGAINEVAADARRERAEGQFDQLLAEVKP